MIKGLRNSAKVVEYKLVAQVKRKKRYGSKKVKDGHSSAKNKAKVETDQNHCIKSLKIKLF
jgi:hypothetical protein